MIGLSKTRKSIKVQQLNALFDIQFQSRNSNNLATETPRAFAMLIRASNDGEITIADALEILKHLAGIITLTGDSLTAALITENSTPTIADALEILKYLAGIPSVLVG